MSDLATTSACTKGNLPGREFDIHCPLMGGPDYKLNYHSFSCRERQLNKTCNDKKCERRVNLVRPCLVQVSAATTKHERDVYEIGHDNRTVCLSCNKAKNQIVGRGLCAACYSRHKKAGDIDVKYPVLRKPAVNKQRVSVVFKGDDVDVYDYLRAWADDEDRSLSDVVVSVLRRGVAVRKGEVA